MLQSLPNSVLQMSVIFLSIVIEALPFVLLGCLISGALQVFLTPERVTKILPKNKLASIAMGCGLGVFFPSCECGIVPIVNQFVKKTYQSTRLLLYADSPYCESHCNFFRHSSHLAIQRSLPFASTWQLVGGNGGRCLAGLFQ